MKLFLLLTGFLATMQGALAQAAESHAAAPAGDTVVLLHGLGRTSVSMLRLARALEREGYHVLNLSYPSRTRSLEEIATQWLPQKLAEASARAGDRREEPGRPPARLHFVTHSMGGIVVRLWLRDGGAPANLGRVVMLAPPNAGSEVSDRLEHFAPFRWFTGANGRRLTTAPGALPQTLGPWPLARAARPPEDESRAAAEHAPGALGIIAGDRALNPLLAACLPAPNDGKVSVARTHLAGETDHLVLPFSHTWLAWRAATIAQVRAFLRTGAFVRAGGAAGR
jgi:hypothetical protein